MLPGLEAILRSFKPRAACMYWIFLNCSVMMCNGSHIRTLWHARICNVHATKNLACVYKQRRQNNAIIQYISLMSPCLQIACIKGANVYTVHIYIYMCKNKMKTTPYTIKNIWPYDLCHCQYPKNNFNSISSQFSKFLLNSGIQQSHGKDQGIKYKQTS